MESPDRSPDLDEEPFSADDRKRSRACKTGKTGRDHGKDEFTL